MVGLYRAYHVLNAALTGHRLSAWEVADVLYLDRGGPRRQHRCDVGRMLDL